MSLLIKTRAVELKFFILPVTFLDLLSTVTAIDLQEIIPPLTLTEACLHTLRSL